MEPMDFDSFVALINEMANPKKEAESPLSQLSSEELALIKSFDPDLIEEISVGKITPSEALLLARSATSNQEQQHVAKENIAECASSVLSEVFEAAEQRLENNRQEAKILKEEADKNPRYYLIYSVWNGPYGDDKEVIEIPVGNDLEVAREECKKLSIERKGLVDVWEKETNKQPVRFINGVETDLSNNPIEIDDSEESLDDVEDLGEDEIIIEEEILYTPELKGKVGKIWQGEPTTDFNEAYEQALAECYMHDDAEIVIRDSLNRNVLLDEGKGKGILNWLRGSSRAGRAATKATKATKASSNAAKASKTSKASGALKTGAATGAGAAGGSFFGGTAKDVANAAVDQLKSGAAMIMNTIDSLAQQGAGITDTKGTTNGSSNDLKLTA